MSERAGTTFTTIVADPAWSYGDKLRMGTTKRSAGDQYRTLSVDEIKAFLLDNTLDDGTRLSATVPDVGFLWLWITNPFLLDGTGAAVCRSWGYTPKQLVTWVKGEVTTKCAEHPTYKALREPRVSMTECLTCWLLWDPQAFGQPPARLAPTIGMGHLTRGATEHMILATRGRFSKLVVSPRNVPNVFVSPRGKHSEKPDLTYRIIERVTPGPYLELFARRRRAGWTSHGDQLGAAS